MRKLIVKLYTGYCGSDTRRALLVDDDATDEEIGEECYSMAVENAESYGIYPYPEYDEDFNDDVEYTEGIDFSFEDYVPEKHDMYRPGGGSFERDFV
jgi:hypothetical protein